MGTNSVHCISGCISSFGLQRFGSSRYSKQHPILFKPEHHLVEREPSNSLLRDVEGIEQIFHGEELPWACSGLLECGTDMAQSQSLYTQKHWTTLQFAAEGCRGHCGIVAGTVEPREGHQVRRSRERGGPTQTSRSGNQGDEGVKALPGPSELREPRGTAGLQLSRRIGKP
eukprot:1185017-Amphidinium_carterae.1